MNKEDIINIIIVAGGNCERFEHLKIFPKLILPLQDDSTVLSKYLDYKNTTTTIALNQKYSNILKDFICANNLKVNSIIDVSNTISSAHTIKNIINDIPQTNVLFVWSDLLISNFNNLLNFCRNSDKDVIFTDNRGKYRYSVTATKQLIHETNYSGNVPGIYFIKNLKQFLKFNHKKYSDFVEVFCKISRNNCIVDISEIDSTITECRDLSTYKKIKMDFHITPNQTRFFNKLTIHDNIATKEVIDTTFKHLIDKEQEWYNFLNKHNPNNAITPHIYSELGNGFSMEYLRGYVPLHQKLDNLELTKKYNRIHKLYNNIFKTTECLFNTSSTFVDWSIFVHDLEKELVTKVIERCDKIKSILINYDKDDLKTILDKSFCHILLFASRQPDCTGNCMKYYFCHGDLNGSNILTNDKLDIKFVDPRGYFGDTKMYGWKAYEYAKILYCLYGYDDFNLKPQIWGIDEPKERISLKYSGILDILGKDYQYYRLMVGIIYVALAGYISQNILKANIAYDYGIKLIKDAYDKLQ